MDSETFDRIARALSDSTTRRRAIGGLAAIVGGALTHVGLSSANAKKQSRRGKASARAKAAPKGGNKGGNSACAKFCANTFGANTPAADECTAEAAKGRGICYQCGPAQSRPTTQKLCGQTCIPNANCCTTGDCTGRECNTRTCISGSCVYEVADEGKFCAGQTGVCVETETGEGTCASGGSALCIGADPCVGAPDVCGVGCACYSTTEQAGFCINRSDLTCNGRTNCDTSAECGVGEFCAPLDNLGTSDRNCCGLDSDKRGFCVPVSTACTGGPVLSV
jgi:hypothetical protein